MEYERRQKQKELGIENTPIDVEYEVKEEVKKDYQWELGDTVYVGIKEYEIIESGNVITLQDKDFPLLTESYTKQQLDVYKRQGHYFSDFTHAYQDFEKRSHSMMDNELNTMKHKCHPKKIEQER